MAERVNGIPHPKKRAFLAAFAQTGNVTVACRAAEIDRKTYYIWTERDPVFSAAANTAKEEAADLLEEACRQRAVEGVIKETPIVRDGRVVDTIVETKYSDTLAIFLLKGLRPEKYRENVDVKHAGTLDVAIREIVYERPQVAGDGRA